MTEAAQESQGRRGVPWAVVLPWVRTLIRVGLGVIWIVAAVPKILDPSQSVAAVAAYELFPQSLNQLIGWALPYFELLLGLVLVAGAFTRWAALASGLLQLVFIAGLLSAWARGLTIDCGCFSAGGQVAAEDVTYGRSLIRDICFTLGAAWLVWQPFTRLSADQALGLGESADDYDDGGESDEERS
jgi:uncharacterized membrane protein YphA (DoxX/SURF4 family)